MNNCKLSVEASNVATQAVTAMLDGGYIEMFAGSQPAGPNEKPIRGIKVCRIALSSPAFGKASNGEAQSRKTLESDPAEADGRVEWFRAYKRDGTPVMDGSVGLSGCDLNINDTQIKTGTIAVVRGMVFSAG
jgi:hypothetical protein